jgi:hypothetical protein
MGQPYLLRLAAQEDSEITVMVRSAKANNLLFIYKGICGKTVYFAGLF